MAWRICTALAVWSAIYPSLAHGQEPGAAELNQAYKALTAKDYDVAIAAFRGGLAKQPGNAGAHKDLAYTLLKAGENADARDEFQTALTINPNDEAAALEFAFLAFETQQPIPARRMFDRLRKSANPETRATAERAFQNIDQPLAASIARWQQALERSDKPNDISMFSAHWELAQTAELRDNLPLAAAEFAVCRQLKPQLSEILLILARVWKEQNRLAESNAALLAASRAGDSRSAELALEQFGPRYPYPYEFVDALKLDPNNITLRRELAYLYLVMHREGDAVDEFERLLAISPGDKQAQAQLDRLRGVAKSDGASTKTDAQTAAVSVSEAKDMGMKSFRLGYIKDAIKYLTQAHELDPDDAEVTVKLAWALNQAHRDEDAVTYFALAKKSKDVKLSAEATKALHTLNGDVLPQTTTWALPMFSTRWHDLFGYAQIKRSLPLPGILPGAGLLNHWISFNLFASFMGDVKSTFDTRALYPLYFSESSFVVGVGASSRTWHHLTGWVEAGESMNYLPGRRDEGLAIPLYRGGLNFAKGFGQLLGSAESGMFYETTADAVYNSRFDKDWIFYWQNRTGRTIQLGDGNKLQLLMNGNLIHDVKNQYWANAVEFGPGLKFHPSWLPPNLFFGADLLRGAYLENQYNPHRPNYWDARFSFWYARTK